MDYRTKRIGIWGFGLTGQSLLSFFTNNATAIQIFNDTPLSKQALQTISNLNASVAPTSNPEQFLHLNDLIIPSSGVDTRPYRNVPVTFDNELDIFVRHTTKPYITITGTSGKTTICHILHQLMSAHTNRIALGGNIGIPMLNILTTDYNCALLELSSFQLEYSTLCDPQLAIWTNFYPNHLDRHNTVQDYFAAKCAMIANQSPTHKALLPLELYPLLPLDIAARPNLSFFSALPVSHEKLPAYHDVYFLHKNVLCVYSDKKTWALHTFTAMDQLERITYRSNWLTIGAALHMLHLPIWLIDQHTKHLSIPEHRLENVATKHGVTFYNDSKSTIPQATMAAVQALHPRPLILLLGGKSKGVNRASLIQQLKPYVYTIICFGYEADQLHQWCQQHKMRSHAYATLEQAFHAACKIAQPGDAVLLSPAGASFDLFTDYVERGLVFKELVKNLVPSS